MTFALCLGSQTVRGVIWKIHFQNICCKHFSAMKNSYISFSLFLLSFMRVIEYVRKSRGVLRGDWGWSWCPHYVWDRHINLKEDKSVQNVQVSSHVRVRSRMRYSHGTGISALELYVAPYKIFEADMRGICFSDSGSQNICNYIELPAWQRYLRGLAIPKYLSIWQINIVWFLCQ